MRILMHANSITERGTTAALLDYADGLRNHGHEPVISWQNGHITNNPKFITLIEENFRTLPYDEFSHLKIKSSDFDAAYFIKGGEYDGKLLDLEKNLVHVVFQNYDPHGNKYFYVSKWLAQRVQKKFRVPQELRPLGFVPHIVNLPKQRKDMRSALGIPKSATVGIRIGGFTTFDIKFVHKGVRFALFKNRNLYFVFINTQKFISHPRAIFIDAISDNQLKSDYLSSADFFLHARSQGESFGIAILEAMSLGVPVLAWEGGLDMNHTELLSPTSLYSGFFDLIDKIQSITQYSDTQLNYEVSLQYRPETVMKSFIKNLH